MYSGTQITGTGIVSCYGIGTQSLVSNLKKGQSKEQQLSSFILQDSEYYLVNEIDRSNIQKGNAGEIQLLIQVIEQALNEANINESLEDCALIIGTSSFLFAAESETRYQHEIAGDNTTISPSTGFAGLITNPVVRHFKIGGPVHCIHTACASSANAMIIAHEMIVRREVSRAIVVGAEGLSAVALSGFQSLMLLDKEGCRPFDAERNGLQIGEAYGAIILEADSKNNNQNKNGTLTFHGGENLCDTHHVTSASPDGSMMQAVIEKAFARACINASDINFIKAHGTGSLDNDTAEAAALKNIFTDSIPPFTILKRYFGHTLGACGVIETIAILACLKSGFIPGTAGFKNSDENLGISPLLHSINASPGYFLSNYFGFGGNYAALIMQFQKD